MTDPNDTLVASWMLALHEKSPATRRLYATGVRLFADWLAEAGRSTDLMAVTRTDVEGWFTHLGEAGLSQATKRSRWIALRSFYGWLVDVDEIDDSPVAKVKVARPDVPNVPVLTDTAVQALLKACQGREFMDRRDMAMLRIFLATGARLAEVTSLQVDDIDLHSRIMVIKRGKGGRSRVARIDPATAAAVDRYLRARSRHRYAAVGDLWIGTKGALGTGGVDVAMCRRATTAGISNFHVHLMRHWWAHTWQAKGGNESSLQVLGGWQDSSTMRRYGGSLRVDRALAHYDDLNLLGDL